MSLSSIRRRRQPRGPGAASFSSSTLAWPDTANWPDSDIDFTIEFWVKFRASISGFTPFITKGTTGPTDGWYVMVEATPHTEISLIANDSEPAAESGLVPTVGLWHYVAFVHRSAASEIQAHYATEGGPLITGELTGSYNDPTGNTSDLRIGGNTWGAHASADMAFLRIWTTALDPATLQRRYNRHLQPRAYPGLVFHWDSIHDPAPGIARELVTGKIATADGTVSRDTRRIAPIRFDDPRWEIAAIGSAGAGGSADATVNAGLLTLTSSVLAPTVSVTANPTISAGLLTMTESVLAPTVGTGVTVSPSLLSLALSLHAPTVDTTRNPTVSAGLLTLTESLLAPTVDAGITVAAGLLTMTESVLAPSVSVTANPTISADLLTMTLSLLASTVSTADVESSPYSRSLLLVRTSAPRTTSSRVTASRSTEPRTTQ